MKKLIFTLFFVSFIFADSSVCKIYKEQLANDLALMKDLNTPYHNLKQKHNLDDFIIIDICQNTNICKKPTQNFKLLAFNMSLESAYKNIITKMPKELHYLRFLPKELTRQNSYIIKEQVEICAIYDDNMLYIVPILNDFSVYIVFTQKDFMVEMTYLVYPNFDI